MPIDFDNIENHAIPLDDFIGKWMFEEEGKLTSKEHQDQISPLTKEASQFLWGIEMKTGIKCSKEYFKSISEFESEYSDKQAIKKYLYNLGIPFDHIVFMPSQPDTGFLMTWKMVIKYAHNIFCGRDQAIWDKTYNWRLEHHHDGIFTFGKDLIYDGQKEKAKVLKMMKEFGQPDNGKGFTV